MPYCVLHENIPDRVRLYSLMHGPHTKGKIQTSSPIRPSDELLGLAPTKSVNPLALEYL